MSVDGFEPVHTGPGTLAGRYLRTFWHPVHMSERLPAGRAIPIRVMGEDFTLYRGTTGTPHLASFRCAHRGTQLSAGWVEGDDIRCRYHGWRYDQTGRCVEQPGEEPASARQVSIRSYPARDYLGLIYVYVGEGDLPPLPRYPDFEEEGVLENNASYYNYNFFQSLENAVDPVHVAFTHRNSSFDGAGGIVGVPTVEAEESAWGLTTRARRPSGVRTVQMGFPTMNHLKSTPDEAGSGWTDSLFIRVPNDDDHHMTFTIRLVRLTGEAAQAYREEHTNQVATWRTPFSQMADRVLRGEEELDRLSEPTRIILVQDEVTQRGQGTIADRTTEHLRRSDVGIALLRQLWMRELRALEAGQPLKCWTYSPELVATEGA